MKVIVHVQRLVNPNVLGQQAVYAPDKIVGRYIFFCTKIHNLFDGVNPGVRSSGGMQLDRMVEDPPYGRPERFFDTPCAGLALPAMIIGSVVGDGEADISQTPLTFYIFFLDVVFFFAGSTLSAGFFSVCRTGAACVTAASTFSLSSSLR